MGKVTGFMEFERLEEGYAPVPERLKHYKEFVIGLKADEAKVQGARCMDCGTPFCNNGCPVNNIIPDFNDLVYRGDWKNAFAVLDSTNNFPEFTGRVCPAPCEEACTLNLENEPVTIKTIEQAIVDRGWEEGWIPPEPPRHETGDLFLFGRVRRLGGESIEDLLRQACVEGECVLPARVEPLVAAEDACGARLAGLRDDLPRAGACALRLQGLLRRGPPGALQEHGRRGHLGPHAADQLRRQRRLALR